LDIKKRIIPIVIFFALIASSIAVGECKVSAAADTTGPVFQSVSVSSNVASGGGAINAYVSATDDSSGVKSAVVWYVSPTGYTCNRATLSQNTGGVLWGTVSINKYSETGNWSVDHIDLYDNAGNMTTVYSENNMFGNLRNLIGGDYNVSSAMTEYGLPVLQGIAVDKKSAGPGTSINLTINASDSESGINYAYVLYTSPSGTATKYSMMYPDSTGALKDTLNIGKYDEAGTWTVDSIEVCDNAGNCLDLYNSEIYADPTMTLRNLSSADFTITGTSVDTTAPAFQSISIDKSNVLKGGDVNVTVKASDAESGISYGVMEYSSPSGAITNYAILFPEANGDLKATISTAADYDEIGKWKVDSIILYDNSGNYIDIYNTETNTDPSLTLKDLSAGDFEICTILNQSAPTGLAGVGTSTHGGTDGKITGTSNLMEYRLSGTSSYTPVTGTEITGLAAGDYYIRFAAREGYNASPEAFVQVTGPEFDVDQGVLLKYNGAGGDVVIPDNLGITSIGSNAFSYSSTLTSVTIPKGVTSIGSYAFRECTALKSLALPSGLTSIEGFAFDGCYSLSSLILPDGLTATGSYAFENCSGLKSITLPSGLKTISSGSFQGCNSLTSIALPSGLTGIESSAFSSSGLTGISIPNSVMSIGLNAFDGCANLTSVTLPSGLTSIDDSVFSGCKNLNTINSYLAVAPKVTSYFFNDISRNAVINILPGATGYDIAPWSNFTRKTMALPVTAIEVTELPIKTKYAVGENLNLTGLVVTGTYDGDIKSKMIVNEANISGFNSSKPVDGQTVTVTIDGKTAAFVVNIIAQPTETVSTGNLAVGKQFTSTKFSNISFVNDGNKTTGSFAEDFPGGGGLQYVQVDLGAYQDINNFKLWHYYGDSRKYKDVVVQVSSDPTFAMDVTTVFNNDADNSAKLGTGNDREYYETSSGLDIKFDPVKARYVRFYSNGSNTNSNNHYVEIEIYGVVPAVHPESVNLSKTTASVETVATYTLAATVLPANTTNKSVTWSSDNTSVATVTATGVVTGIKAGTAVITATTADGGMKDSCTVTVTSVPKNLTTGKLFSSTVFNSISSITDGNKSLNSLADDYPNGGGLQYVQMDLGAYYDLSKINLWHYYGDGRKYNDVIVRVSNDPAFATDVTTVYNNDSNNSAGFGIGTDAAYAETSAGLTIPIDMVNARYVRLYSNGSDKNSNNHYAEAEVYGFEGPVVHPSALTLNKDTDALSVGGTSTLTAKVTPLNTTDKSVTWTSSATGVATVSASGAVTGVTAGKAIITATTVDGKLAATCEVTVTVAPGNLSAGKLFTSSVFKDLGRVTDGSKSTGNFAEDYPNGGGLQYMQLDLGAYYDLSNIKLWHYYGDGRKYKDVIVQVSNDPAFATDVTTVYSNDTDNSAKLGTGTKTEYAETSAGLNVQFDTVNARYVRLYSNGSNLNNSNHYVEVEVYGLKGAAVHPSSVSLNKSTMKVVEGAADSLAASVMPLNTTDKSVTWKSSDESVATVSSAGLVTGVKAGTAIITATTADGGIEQTCTVTVTPAPLTSNLSAGKLFTSSVFKDIARITDGSKSTGSFSEDYPAGGGLQYVQVDLGAYYDLSDIKLWHYFGDGRKYKDVAVRVSNDPTFAADVTTVYNNDTDNSSKLGTGTNSEYAETSAGLDIAFDAVNARYVRFYSNGSNLNTSNHYVEAEIYGAKGAVVLPASVSLSKTTDTLSIGATDTLAASVMPLNTTDKGVTWKSSDESVATVSSSGAVTGIKAGTATITATTVAGSIEAACMVTVTAAPAISNLTSGKLFASSVFKDIARITDGSKSTGSFSEDYPNGGGLQYVQVDLGGNYDVSDIKLWHYYGDGRKYKDVIVQVSNDPTFTTGVKTVYNNDTNNSAGRGAGTSSEYAETSAGLDITADAVNGRYVRFYSNGSSMNTSNHYVEIEIYGSKSTTVSNQAAGKTMASSVNFTNLSRVTDGSKSTGSFAEDYPAGGGLQWVQADLGISYDISDIKLWHYFGDGRKYHDVVVQVSDDPTFKTGVKTVYNNDIDGSAGLGTGSGGEYTETSSGLDIPVTSVTGRYVRLYSNGSTANSNNHYVELEVYGK